MCFDNSERFLVNQLCMQQLRSIMVLRINFLRNQSSNEWKKKWEKKIPRRSSPLRQTKEESGIILIKKIVDKRKSIDLDRIYEDFEEDAIFSTTNGRLWRFEGDEEFQEFFFMESTKAEDREAKDREVGFF